MTYFSPSSDAISKVTFYKLQDESNDIYYFALVRFKSSFKEYIYQVSSQTEAQYSYNYLPGAGEAFWEYIQPYADVLGCGLDL